MAPKSPRSSSGPRWGAAAASIALLATLLAGDAHAQGRSAQQQLAFDIYKELVEINTVTDTGDTLRAAEAMAARLRAAGFEEADVRVLSPGPRKGNMVARLRGSGARRPILLLAHMDVVEARPSDWTTEPFKLVDKDGYYYARGSGDDKFMAATFVSNLIRYKQEGYRPDRDIIVALDTDEEILDRNVQGIQWLIKNHRDLIDAEFALNEGGGVGLKNGKPQRNSVQTAEKVSVNFQLEATDKGGHSSIPTAGNPIYRLSEGLARLGKVRFPLGLNDTTRVFFDRIADLETEQTARDMRAVLAGELDGGPAVARLSANPVYNAQLRTTCTATLLEGGHAINALPQVARAGVNCRMLPGEPVEEVQATIARVLADDSISIKLTGAPTASAPSPLRPDVMNAIGSLTKEFWPGVPVVPVMSAGATDGSYLRNAGIPTYGHSGLAADVDDVRAHGRDERVLIKGFWDGQEYLYRLVKTLSGGE